MASKHGTLRPTGVAMSLGTLLVAVACAATVNDDSESRSRRAWNLESQTAVTLGNEFEIEASEQLPASFPLDTSAACFGSECLVVWAEDDRVAGRRLTLGGEAVDQRVLDFGVHRGGWPLVSASAAGFLVGPNLDSQLHRVALSSAASAGPAEPLPSPGEVTAIAGNDDGTHLLVLCDIVDGSFEGRLALLAPQGSPTLVPARLSLSEATCRGRTKVIPGAHEFLIILSNTVQRVSNAGELIGRPLSFGPSEETVVFATFIESEYVVTWSAGGALHAARIPLDEASDGGALTTDIVSSGQSPEPYFDGRDLLVFLIDGRQRVCLRLDPSTLAPRGPVEFVPISGTILGYGASGGLSHDVAGHVYELEVPASAGIPSLGREWALN